MATAVGPGRNDGVNRVYAASNDGHVYEFSWTGSNWSSLDMGSGAVGMQGVALGSGRNDGAIRVYASNSAATTTDGNIYEFSWTGTSWSKSIVGKRATNWGMDQVAVGGGRNDGVNRVYGGNLDGNLYEFTWNGAGWNRSTISFGVGLSGSYSPVIGAGRNDGVNRIYLGNDNFNIYELTWTGSSWSSLVVGTGTWYGRGVSIGTGRNDGVKRIYAIAGQALEFSWNGTSWSSATVGGLGLPVPGPGRNTNQNFLYSTDAAGTHEFQWNGSSWAATTDLASFGQAAGSGSPLALGAGRNDAVMRAYAPSGSSVYELTNAPTGVNGTALGISSISWTWNAATGATSYKVYRATSPTTLLGTAGSLSFEEQGLIPNTLYGVVVSSGGGPLSAAATAYTLAAPPTGFALVQVWTSSISVSWGTNNNPSGTSYQLQYWPSFGSTTTLTASASTAALSNLSGSTTYYLAVSAVNGNNVLAPASAILSTTTLPVLSSTAAVGSSGGSAVLNNSRPVTIQVPSGAFAQTVSISLDLPGSYPPPHAPASNLAGTSIGINVSLSPDIEPNSNVTLYVSYLPPDIAGLDSSRLILARYDASQNVWVPLVSTLDKVNNRVIARSNHLSLFQIMSSQPSASVSAAKAFPNPWKESQVPTMTFSLLPAGARIRVYTLTGALVKDLSADAAGLASWDGTNQSGAKVASGFYFALIQGNGRSETMKLAIQK